MSILTAWRHYQNTEARKVPSDKSTSSKSEATTFSWFLTASNLGNGTSYSQGHLLYWAKMMRLEMVDQIIETIWVMWPIGYRWWKREKMTKMWIPFRAYRRLYPEASASSHNCRRWYKVHLRKWAPKMIPRRIYRKHHSSCTAAHNHLFCSLWPWPWQQLQQRHSSIYPVLHRRSVGDLSCRSSWNFPAQSRGPQ